MSVGIDAAKAECRVTGTAHDARITQYLNAAIAWVENHTRKKLTATSAVSQTFAAFPDYFTLQWGPSPASVEIEYTDTAGDTQEITTARLVDDKLYPPLDTEWPDIEANSTITVSYTAGYTDTPDDLDLAVLLFVREMFDGGSISIQAEKAINLLCQPYRVPVLR